MSRIVELKPRVVAKGMVGFRAEPDKTVQQKVQEYGDRVLKFIPAEVVAFYVAAIQLITAKEGDAHAKFRFWAFVIVGIVALVGTPFYIALYTKKPKELRVNAVVASAAFIIWAYAYPQGWFSEMGWHEPVTAGLLLLGFTFAIGLYQPRE